jgi:hypothetical protein
MRHEGIEMYTIRVLTVATTQSTARCTAILEKPINAKSAENFTIFHGT